MTVYESQAAKHARKSTDEPTEALRVAMVNSGLPAYPIEYHQRPKRRYLVIQVLAMLAIAVGVVLAALVLMLRTKHQPVPVPKGDVTSEYCLPASDGWWHCSRSPIDSIPPVPSNGPVI